VGWSPDGTGKEYGITQFNGDLENGTSVLLAAVDPAEEDALVGLKNSVVKSDSSRYFNSSDQISTQGDNKFNIPVLLSNKEFVNGGITYSVERLDLPYNNKQVADKTLKLIKNKGGKSYLSTLKTKNEQKYTLSYEKAHQLIVNEIKDKTSLFGPDSVMPISYKPTPVKYKPVKSPFPHRWPFAYDVIPFNVPQSTGLPVSQSYRTVKTFGDYQDFPKVDVNFIGVFDPTKLHISKDPLTQLPMETYFPSKATLVLNAKDSPVNPPQTVTPEDDEYGFLTKPPLMITTLDAAAKILGDKPISSIRIKVKGVTKINPTSKKILDKVASEIEQKTGLIADVTLGSSPQPALTHIPSIDGKSELGWVEQPWIKIGASMSIFQEAKVGLSGILASVILVAIVYVFSSNLISMYARRREFAVLLALGWRRAQLSKLIIMEALLLGLFVSLVSWAILGAFFILHHVGTTGLRVLLIGLCGLAIYFLGSLIPAFLVRKIQPYDAMRSGEITTKSHRFFGVQSFAGLSFSYLLTNWKRSLLSIISIALPTSLLIVFLFITFRLKGVMYATWLGQYVALEVGTMQYIAMAVAMLIAVLTTAEIMWQNISERQPEIALFKAVGWQSTSIRWLVLLEGAISGFVAGVVGLVLAMGILWFLYHHIPYDHLLFLILTLIVPIVTGVIGALIPAEKAVKISPSQGMQGGYNNEVRNEKRMRVLIGIVLAVLFIGFLTVIAYSIPEISKSIKQNAPQKVKVEGTEGKVTHSANKEEKKANQGEINKQVKRSLEPGEEELQAGEAYNDPNISIEFSKMVPTPGGNLPKLKPNMKFISIPIDFKLVDNGRTTFNGYENITDSAGHSYTPVLRSVLKEKNWVGRANIYNTGEAKYILTYMVPKNLVHFTLVFDQDWLAGKIFVDY
jgi:hypothetical protein